MKYSIYIFLFSFGSLFAQGEKLFEQANQAYSQGDYEQAIENYEGIIDNGKASVSVYYNLANAHYQLDHVAESIYFYEKALQLKPNDEDVLNNLAFAEKKTIDAVESVPKTGISELFNDMVSTMGYNGWAWTAVVASILFAVLFLGYWFSRTSTKKRMFFVPSMIFLVIGIASFIFANLRLESVKNRQFAIIFAQEAQVKSAPNQQSELAFLLHEGTKVRVLEDFGEWFEIEIADGKQGWIQQSGLKKL